MNIINLPVQSLYNFFYIICKTYKLYIGAILCIGFCGAAQTSWSPYILKLIIEQVSNFDGDKNQIFSHINLLATLYVGSWAFVAILLRLQDFLKLKFFPKLHADIIQSLNLYLSYHSHAFFQDNFAGSLSNKISDMATGVTAIFSTLHEAWIHILGLIIAIITMYLVHPIFATILFFWALCFLLIAAYNCRKISLQSKFLANGMSSLTGCIVDNIANITNTRLFVNYKFEQNILHDATQDVKYKSQAMQWYVLKMYILWDISIIILMSANLYSLIYMYSQSLVTLGDFAFILSLTVSMFYSLWYLATKFVAFSEDLGKCNQALQLINMPHAIKDKALAKPLRITHASIEFNNVAFSYKGASAVFSYKYINIKPGTKVGIVGLSGSGKTTLVNLILRLFELDEGEIYIDGQNIANCTQDSIRKNIALISQDISLFHRSILENIRYGNIYASDEQVIAAAKQAYCHDFIIKLADGYHTLVGEKGVKLSVGQRQRIAIARAILKNAPILILDEATSALDSITEKSIQLNLKKLMQYKTTLVIAHRLVTLTAMNRIIVLHQGQVVEDGLHKDLIQQGGLYARMWQMQAGGFLPSTTLSLA